MPTSKPLPTAAARLMAFADAHASVSNFTNQVTAISTLEDGVDTTSPLFVDDIREAAQALGDREGTVNNYREAQYGIRFPNGEVQWVAAQDAVRLHPDGSVQILSHALNQDRLDPQARAAVNLANVANGGNGGRDLADFISQADDIAAAARIDVEVYLRDVTVVRRYITVSVTSFEVVKNFIQDEVNAEDAPSS